MLDSLRQDIRYGFRMLAKKPGFTFIAILTLALGIGANTTIFSLMNSVLLRQLPYRDPDKLMVVWNDYGDHGQSLPAVSPPDFLDYQKDTRLFEDFAAASGAPTVNLGSLTSDGPPTKVEIAATTSNFFSILGVDPIYGRHFLPEEAVPNGPKVAIISYGLWQSRFGGDKSLIGKAIKLGGEAYSVVGILPANFKLLLPEERFVLNDSDIWLPLQVNPQFFGRNLTSLTVLARLKPDVTMAQAQSEMDGLAAKLRNEFPVHQTSGMRIRLVPLHEDVVKNARPAIMLLLGSVVFVLLIACANVANLFLARAGSREKEIAIRAALGAGRIRIIRQILTECLLLSFAGGILGLVLSFWGLDLLISLQPGNMPRIDEVKIDGRTLLFTFGACLLTTLLFGLAPAWQVAKSNTNELLKESGRPLGNSGRQPMRKFLVISEVALSLILLVGAGLFIRSFICLQQIKPGFDATNVTSFKMALPPSQYKTREEVINFYKELETKVAAIPGVEKVGSIMKPPFTGSGAQTPYAYDAETAQKWESLSADWRSVTANYFNTMGIKLVAGRFFDEHDASGPPVLIIDETLARKAWPNESAVGKKLQISFSMDRSTDRGWYEVVGVIEHVRSHDITRDVREQVYMYHRHWSSPAMTLMVKTSNPNANIGEAVQRVVHEMDSQLPLFNVRSMDSLVSGAMAHSRFTLILIGFFGATALTLALIGIYGTISFSVSQRTREIGIRMALGAQKHDILKMIVMQGFTMICIGIAIGLGSSFLLTRLLRNFIFGVSVTDPLTYSFVTLLLAIIALLACFIPARRATKVDPMLALRYE